MTKQEATQTAQVLLDSEFDEANHNPVDYCRAMGWNKDSKGTQNAIKKKGSLVPSVDDVENLAQIVLSIGSDESFEIQENNSVSDFLCNCVAGHIIA
ncbi:MAG TPA: hypothetical protein VMX17_00990 [Candidatus Glassbacteria bacterium]|nr:hypothetical protein [Candidatus Glassbacteria bacterium]